MLQDHRLQQQRFELKYLIEESLTLKLRDFISSHLEPDEFGAHNPNLSYPVHSVYLDSDDLHTHYETVNGSKNRYKLRLRYYDDNPASPVFFEIKRRVDNCIIKRRCGVRRAAVPQILSGQLPELDQLFTTDPRHVAALERFLMLMTAINARPKAHNCYLREAWVSPHDNSARVTFDRQMHIEPHFRFTTTTGMRQPVPVLTPGVVLELKFTSRFPNWFNELVQCFNLMQSSAAKYSDGVRLLGEQNFRESILFNHNDPVAPLVPSASAEELLGAKL